MAVSYVGKSSSMGSSANTISVSVPNAYAAGDLLVLLLEGYSAMPATPSGWSDLDTQTNTNTYFKICYKTSAASESSVTIADSGDSTRGTMLCFRGWSSISVLAKSTCSGTSYSATGGTTSIDGSIVVVATGFFDGDANDTPNYSSIANASLDTFASQLDQSTYAGSGGGIFFALGVDVTAGTVGTTTATADASGNYSANIVFAIAPTVNANVTAVAGAGTAAASAPTISAAAAVSAVAGECVAGASAPTVTGGTSGSGANVDAVSGAASAGASAPTATGKASVSAVAGASTAGASAPTVSGGAGVTAVAAQAVAGASAPSITGAAGITAVAGAAVAGASAPTITAEAGANVDAAAGAALAGASAPAVSGSAGVTAVAAAAVAGASAPTITAVVVVNVEVLAVACAAIAAASAPWARQHHHPEDGVTAVQVDSPRTEAVAQSVRRNVIEHTARQVEVITQGLRVEIGGNT